MYTEVRLTVGKLQLYDGACLYEIIAYTCSKTAGSIEIVCSIGMSTISMLYKNVSIFSRLHIKQAL